jgi:Tfp pilus assembly protein PilO
MAQSCLLGAMALCLGILAYAALWREDISRWSSASKQQQELIHQRQERQILLRHSTSLASWLPLHALGCHVEEIKEQAAHQELELIIGKAEPGITHGQIRELSMPLQVNASYQQLQELVSALAAVNKAWVLDPLNLTHGPEQLIELQADVRCIELGPAEQAKT